MGDDDLRAIARELPCGASLCCASCPRLSVETLGPERVRKEQESSDFADLVADARASELEVRDAHLHNAQALISDEGTLLPSTASSPLVLTAPSLQASKAVAKPREQVRCAGCFDMCW